MTVKGVPNTTGTIVVYKDSVTGTEVTHVSLDPNGRGTVSCDNSTVTAPLPPPLDPSAGQSNLALWTSRAASPYFTLLKPQGTRTNLALGKAASASSTWNAESAPSKAMNSRLDTSWISAPGQTNDQWLQIDFGAPVSFEQREDPRARTLRKHNGLYDSGLERSLV